MEHLFNQAALVGTLLKDRQETVAVAESSAGGLISASLLSVSGASAYYLGGGVIYTREARRHLLGLPEDQVTMPGANEDYALIVAKAIQVKLGATWGLCETGATGPTGNRYGNPAGHVCIAVSGPQDKAMTLQTNSSERQANMHQFAETSLAFLRQILS